MYRWWAEAARPSNARTNASRDGASKPEYPSTVVVARRGGVLALAGSVGVSSEMKWRRPRGGVLARGGIGSADVLICAGLRGGNGDGDGDHNFGICNFGIRSFGIRNLDGVASTSAAVSVSESGVEGRTWNAEANCRPSCT